MYNKEIFDKANKLMGSWFAKGAKKEWIDKLEEGLGVKLPDDYKIFIEELGEGGICGAYYTFGIDGEDWFSVEKHTQKAREQYNIDSNYIVIAEVENDNLYCIDTATENRSVVKLYDVSTKKWETKFNSFDEYFDYINLKIYEECNTTEPEQERKLPDGMGYKNCWLVVEGMTQKEISNILLSEQGRVNTEYHTGLMTINNADVEEKMLMITSDNNNQNYVMGNEVSSIFYRYDTFFEKMSMFPKVYAYMTNRVSECHGFALLEYGKIIRLYCCDEEQIRSIGSPLKEECDLELSLPKSILKMQQENNLFTPINEEVIVRLAEKQIGIDVENYPYDNVVIGKVKLE